MKFERDTWNCEGGRMVPVITNVPEITYVPFPVYDTLRRQLAEAEALQWPAERHEIHDALDAMRQRAEIAESKLALAEQDARLWRGLIGSARVRVIGSAGLRGPIDPNGQPFNGYAHIGLELWTKHDAGHEPDDAVEWLTRYAAIAAGEVKGD